MSLLLELLDLLLMVGAALSGVLRSDEARHVHEDLSGLLLEGEVTELENEVEVVNQVLLGLPVLDHPTPLRHLIYMKREARNSSNTYIIQL